MTDRQRPKRGGQRKGDKVTDDASPSAASAEDTKKGEVGASGTAVTDTPAEVASSEKAAAEKKPVRPRAPRKRSSNPPKQPGAEAASSPTIAPPRVPAKARDVTDAAPQERTPTPTAKAEPTPQVIHANVGAHDPIERSNRVTVAPPAKRGLAGERVHDVVAVNGSALRSEAPEEEIWTDGAGIDGPRAVARDRQDSADPAARLARGSSGDRLHEAAAFGSAQSLLSTDYYFRQYGAHGMRSLVAEIDEMGFDPHVDAKVRPLLETLCKRYFRVGVSGAEHLPENGRALLVANRSGALPWDGLVLRTALRVARPELCPLRWLAEDSVIHYPFMGVMMNRLGAVRACPENAERLLSQDRLVAVFPEGAQGSRKLFRDRYRLQRFGRGGYVKLALKFGVPILPTAIIGAEETNPVLGRSRLLGRIVGTESVPITPTFPWLGPLGLLPAPIKWRIAIGEPIDLSKHGPRSADDALVVHRLNEQIRAALQNLVDESKTARGRALFG